MTALILMSALVLQEDFAKKLDEILPRLASEGIAEREAAVAELFKQVDSAGPRARAPLRARLRTATDPSVRQALEAALNRLPVLELKIEVEGEAKVGEPVKFRVRIKNIGDEEVAVVRSLDGSDDGMRYPMISAVIVGPDGKAIPRPGPMRSAKCNRLKKEDLTALMPGQESDPFGPGASRDFRLEGWTPGAEGKHAVGLTIDYSAKEPARWDGSLGPSELETEPLRRLLALVPRVKLEAKADFDVKE